MMGVRIIEDRNQGYKALYCSTTMWAFGGIFYEDEDPQEFLNWLSEDPRSFSDVGLESKMTEWRAAKIRKENGHEETLRELNNEFRIKGTNFNNEKTPTVNRHFKAGDAGVKHEYFQCTRCGCIDNSAASLIKKLS